MAAYDADVFGAPAAAGGGFDADVFSASVPVKQPPVAQLAAAQQKAAPVGLRGEGYEKAMKYDGRNQIGGAIRGAGSIGSTLLAPFDYAEDALKRAMGMAAPAVSTNTQRRRDIDAGLTSAIGSDPNSTEYKTTKLLAEIGGTSGAGGFVADLVGKIPGAAAKIPGLLDAIRTGGMSANGYTGAGGMATRVAGGAVNGAATAGLVDPLDAPEGAMIGSAFPVATKLAGETGGILGRVFGPSAQTANPTKLQTAKESMEAGYVIPPNMIKPSFKNSVIESISGKQATAQIASTKNQAISEGLARRSLGLPQDAPLTFETMKSYRAAQHQAGYEPLRQVGMIPAGSNFNRALDDIANQYKGKGTIPAIADSKKEISDLVALHKSTGFDAGDAVDAIRTLREDATALFQSTSAGDKAKAKATKAIADAYEGAIDDALGATGNSKLLTAYRDARQNIAKSGTVEKAIREGSGTLDARILAREFQKGKPLTGDLKTVAKFANTFDKAAQPPHLIGSPAVHNLNSMFSAGGGGLGAGLGSVIGGAPGAVVGGALGAGYPYVVPPIARSMMFSKGAQQGLLSAPSGQGLLSTSLDEALPLMYRTNPLLGQGLIGQ
ncbi:MAG: hypothetical protein V4858_17250 [Pseudomonadota bacterium]